MNQGELITTKFEETFAIQTGCWWGVFAGENPNDIELSVRAFNEQPNLLLSSSPSTVIEFSPSGKLRLSQWWRTAKRHAVQHFWGPLYQSSAPLILVLGALKSKRFIAFSETRPVGVEPARIKVCGAVDDANEILRLTTERPWQVDEKEQRIRINSCDEERACAVNQMNVQMFKLEDDLEALAKRVWKYGILFWDV